MAKCSLTGFEMDLENACILDRGGAKRALHSLKERLTAPYPTASETESAKPLLR